MADTTRVTTLIVRSQSDGVDQTKQSVKDLGDTVDATSASMAAAAQKQDTWRQSLNSLAAGMSSTGQAIDGVTAKLDTSAKVASTAGLAFDSIGFTAGSTSAAQFSGRLSEVSDALGLVSSGLNYGSQALGTHGDATQQLADKTRDLADAQGESSDASALATAGWIAAGAAAVALVGVAGGLVVGVIAIKDAIVDVVDATGEWIAQMATGGLLDNMEQLAATGQKLNDIGAVTGQAAAQMGVLATGLQGSGLSAQSTQSIFDGLGKTLMGTGADAVAARTTMREMGIDIDALGKNGNDLQAVFLALAGQLSQYQDSAEKTKLEQQLLGSASAEVINGVDGATAAFARQDAQTRSNIANLAAYVAETDQIVAKYKELRDNEPVSLGQSQMSGALGRVNQGFLEFDAGFNGGGGLFSSSGRGMMGTGLDQIGTGIEAGWDTVDQEFQKGAVSFFNELDDMFGSELTAEMKKAAQTRLDQLGDAIQGEIATPTPDMRSGVPTPQEGSAQWAASANTSFAAQYDIGTAALQKFTVAYAQVLDMLARGQITEDQATQATMRLSAAYAAAADPVGKFLAQQQASLTLLANNPSGPQRDAAQLRASLLSQAGSLNGGADLSSDQLSQINSIVSQTGSQKAADDAAQKAKQIADALAKLHTSNQEAVADSTALATAWNDNAKAGLLVEAQTQALSEVRAIDKNATASQTDVIAKLTASYEEAFKSGAQYVQSLKEQADAAAALAAAGGDPIAQNQAQINSQVDQQFAKELQLAQILDAQLGTSDNTLAVMEQMTDAAAQLANIHDSQVDAALKSELASQNDQITAAQTQLQYATKNSQEARVALAIEQEKANLRRMGVEDLKSEDAQQAINNASTLADIQAEADARAKAYQEEQRQVKDVANQIERTMSTDIYDVLSGKNVNLAQSFRDLWLHAIADVAAKAAETEIVMPIVGAVFGVSGGGGGSSAGILGGSSSLSGLSSLGSSAGLMGSLFGISGSDVSSFLGISDASGGLMGTLFGTGSVATTQLEGDAFIPSAAEEMANMSAPTSGLLTSGGFQSLGIGSLGGALAGVGGGILGGSLLNGFAGGNSTNGLIGGGAGAIAGLLLGGPWGAAAGGVLGSLLGGVFGPGKSVGPNSSAQVLFQNGSPVAGPTGADNGGDISVALTMQQAAIAAFQSVAGSIAGLAGTPGISVGTFGGKYFGTDKPGGGNSSNATYTSEGDAIANAVLMALKDSDLSKVDPNVRTAVGNIAVGSSAATINSDLTFATQFTAAINAMKAGTTDFTQAAEVAAETTANQLTTSIDNFISQTQSLGLSVSDATSATKDAVESFLGMTNSPAISQTEQNVETLYGKLEGVSGLLSTVGINQADATASVKAQVEAILGITQAAPALGTYASQLAGLKQTFSDLAPILTALGISASDAATALSTAETNLTTAANDNIRTQLDALTGGISSSLQALVTTFTTTFADIEAVGGNLSNAQELMALDIANLYKPQTTAAIQDVNAAFQAQITTETNLASTAAKTTTDLQTFLTSMAAGSLSNGDPQSQLQAAKQAFDQAVTNSESSDPTIAANAQGQLTSLAQQYLTASKAYNASGAGYTSDYDYVQQQLEKVEGYTANQATTATQQVTLLQEQLTAATGIQTNTLTIAQATQNLTDLMQQMNQTIAASIAAAGGGVWGGSVSPNSNSPTGVSATGAPNYANPSAVGTAINTVAGYYTNLLGRSATGSELSYYVNLAEQGTSLSQIQQYFMNSPEYLASHTHAAGGVASGWSMVGEQGPEPVYFGQQARVFTNQSFRDAIGAGNNDNSSLVAAIQALQAEVVSLRQITAQGAIQTVGELQAANRHLGNSSRATARLSAKPRAA